MYCLSMPTLPTKDRAVPAFIRKLMPKASEAELRLATEVFADYIAVAWRIFLRNKRGPRDSPKRASCDRVESTPPHT